MRWIRCCIAAAMLWPQPAWAAKNVIIMVSDGAGQNVWRAASMYQGKLGKQVYDAPGWNRWSVTTYPLNRSQTPTGNAAQDQAVVYDAAKAWDKSPPAADDKAKEPFAGYLYLKTTYTASAASATALATGQKTYNNAINWSNLNQPMRGQTIAEIAKAGGKSAGAITTVEWSHATPAGLGGAHNVSRNHYAEIANEMLAAPYLDVLMGAGNPDFDDDGRPRSDKPENREYSFVGGRPTWEQLKAGKHPAGWKLIESKADFEALAAGDCGDKKPKILGTAQVATTLQQNRGRGLPQGSGKSVLGKEPFQQPLSTNVPTLAVMSRAAMNCLSKNPNGFYLMIEGGAVDWANHANEGGRMIEEQIDFVQAVEAVVDWVNQNSSWDDTLLILTADHESGFLWGPNSNTAAFDPIRDNGPGKMPGLRYNLNSHSNSLVPVYVRGPGSERFATLVKGTDKTAAEVWGGSDKYVDNTDIFRVMNEEIQALHKKGP